MSFQAEMFDVIQELTDSKKTVVVPKAYIDITDSLIIGTFLAQLVYWTDKGCRNDGWIYKSSKEWQDELHITDYSVREAQRKLKELGIIETKLMKSNGAPVLHYRIIKENLISLLNGYSQQIHLLNSTNRNVENNKSYNTENNIYNITEKTYQNRHTEKPIKKSHTQDNSYNSKCECVDLTPHMDIMLDKTAVILDFGAMFDDMVADYPKKNGLTAARKIVLDYVLHGHPDLRRMDLHIISLAVRSYVIDWKQSGREARYIKNLDKFLTSDDFIDYINSNKDIYEDGMKNKYGTNWENIRFYYNNK